MALMNTRLVLASSPGTIPMEMHRLIRAMMIDAPSSTPRIGRNESDRYSKNESIHATLPRTLARSAALTSASDCALSPATAPLPAPTPAISGRCMMFSYIVATAPPMTTW